MRALEAECRMQREANNFGTDICRSIHEADRKKARLRREQLLKAVNVKEFFEEGSIRVDMKTCRGAECMFCIKVCPTNALYWKTSGEIGIIPELCVYCASCVLNCMVDNCITIERKRPNGKTERYRNPREVQGTLEDLNTRNRMKTVKRLFSEQDDKNKT